MKTLSQSPLPNLNSEFNMTIVLCQSLACEAQLTVVPAHPLNTDSREVASYE